MSGIDFLKPIFFKKKKNKTFFKFIRFVDTALKPWPLRKCSSLEIEDSDYSASNSGDHLWKFWWICKDEGGTCNIHVPHIFHWERMPIAFFSFSPNQR